LVGVSREVIEHKLQVNPNAKPKKQKLRKMSEEKIEAVKAEVQHLLNTRFIREVTYPQWLANVIDSAAGCDIMAMLDCFSGYHQIWLRKEDEDKTSFITPFGTYCYMRMPEGLRNAGPTFCRMTKATLKDQVRRNVLSYVDDIIVASKKKESYISDLSETFTNMREANLKLNPEK
jgi:hypothetical protein